MKMDVNGESEVDSVPDPVFEPIGSKPPPPPPRSQPLVKTNLNPDFVDSDLNSNPDEDNTDCVSE